MLFYFLTMYVITPHFFSFRKFFVELFSQDSRHLGKLISSSFELVDGDIVA